MTDWSKQRCWICGGHFKPGTTTLYNERTGEVRQVARTICQVW